MKRPLSTIYLLLYGITCILLLGLAIFAKADYGGGDSTVHYVLSRYAHTQPSYYFDMWGKPVFTLLSSPFSQFGYHGMRVFNTLMGFLAAFLAFKTAKSLDYKNAYLAFAFTLFSPIFLININTGMTETIFSLMLISSFFFLLKDKAIIAAIIVSFMPFSRTEGVIFIPSFLILFILLKNYRAIPFLILGYLVYNLAGWLVLDKLFFISDLNPYKVSEQPYGTGSFWFYIGNLNEVIGIPILILIIIGTILISRKKSFDFLFKRKDLVEISLVITFTGFLLLQSILWWKGLFSVRGNLRYLVSIIPLGAVIGLKAFNFLLDLVRLKEVFKNLIILSFTALVMAMPFVYYDIPMPLSGEQVVTQKVANWLKKYPLSDSPVFYYNINIPIEAGMNPQNRDKCVRIWNGLPVERIPDSALLIWDSHYGGYEGKVSLDTILVNPDFRLIHVSTPEDNFNVIGGTDYKICVFQKIERDSSKREIRLYENGFEQEDPEQNVQRSDSLSYEGNYSARLMPDQMYGQIDMLKEKDLPANQSCLIRVEVMVYPLDDPREYPFFLVLSGAQGEKIFSYVLLDAKVKKLLPGQWNKMSAEIYIEKDELPGLEFRAYIWNKGKTSLFYDALKIDYYKIN